jgi:hypothetical protein
MQKIRQVLIFPPGMKYPALGGDRRNAKILIKIISLQKAVGGVGKYAVAAAQLMVE